MRVATTVGQALRALCVLSMGTKIWDPERSPEKGPEQTPEQGPEWKIDIQSWVLIRPFSTSFGSRNGREMAIRPTKKLICSAF